MRNTLIAGCFAILVGMQCGYAESQKTNWFTWSQLPSLPASSTQNEPIGVAGPFVGVHNEVLIIAGGANFPKPFAQTQKTWHSDIWVLDKNTQQWQGGFTLDRPVAYGGSVSTRYGVICIGGNDADRSYDTVFMLQWDNRDRKIIKKDLPSLPLPCAHTSAACIGDTVYLAGGQQDTSPASVMHNFWRLDLSKMGQGQAFAWEPLPVWPGPARAFNVTAAQHNGMEMCVYVIGGRMQASEDIATKVVFNDVYEFSPSKYDASAYDAASGQYRGQAPWRKRADLPVATSAITGIDAGQSHILLFGAAATAEEVPPDVAVQGFCTTVLAYHTITDTYMPVGQMPAGQVTTTAVKWNDALILPSGEIHPRVRTPEVWMARWVRQQRHFGWLNFTSLGLYLLATTLFGMYFAKRNKTTDDFFRGGKRIPAWAAGLSIFATMLSSITFVAIPAKVFASDWTFLTINMMCIAAIPILWFYIVPFFMRADATTAYEFLEKRFGLAVRLFAALSFVLFQCGRMAIVMYLPSLALSAITGLTVSQSILIMGVLSVIYCTMGGFEAVVWTDCVQAIVLIGGAVLSLGVVLFSTDGGIAGLIHTAAADNKFHTINWDFSSTSFTTSAFWVMIVSGLSQYLVPFVSDQAIVQRFLSVTDIRAARKSILMNTYASIPATLLFFSIGTALYVFYKSNPARLDPGYPNDAIFPLFISTEIPVGLAGIVVAGIYAAAQSTIATSMNSVSTVVVTDFVRRFSLLGTEQGYFRLARLCTLFFGILGTGLALLFASANVKSLWEAFMEVLGLFGGSLCGLFLLAIFTRRVGGIAAMTGALASVGLLFYIKQATPVSFLLYAAIGMTACFIIGLAVSFLLRETPRQNPAA